MIQTVTVLSVKGNRAKVIYNRPAACHMDCEHCAGGCSALAAREQILVDAENCIGAKAGDQVLLSAETRTVFSVILLVYALPILLFFLGYALGWLLKVNSSLCGILGFFFGILIAVLVSHTKRRTGREIAFQIIEYANKTSADA